MFNKTIQILNHYFDNFLYNFVGNILLSSYDLLIILLIKVKIVTNIRTSEKKSNMVAILVKHLLL